MERYHSVEAIFIHGDGKRFVERLARIKALAHWAARAMAATRENAIGYQDVLYRIAISTPDDRILVDRVRDDLAAAGVFVTRDRIGAILDISDN